MGEPKKTFLYIKPLVKILEGIKDFKFLLDDETKRLRYALAELQFLTPVQVDRAVDALDLKFMSDNEIKTLKDALEEHEFTDDVFQMWDGVKLIDDLIEAESENPMLALCEFLTLNEDTKSLLSLVFEFLKNIIDEAGNIKDEKKGLIDIYINRFKYRDSNDNYVKIHYKFKTDNGLKHSPGRGGGGGGAGARVVRARGRKSKRKPKRKSKRKSKINRQRK